MRSIGWDVSFDIGPDTSAPVDQEDCQVPFRFKGKLIKLTVELQPIRGTLVLVVFALENTEPSPDLHFFKYKLGAFPPSCWFTSAWRWA